VYFRPWLLAWQRGQRAVLVIALTAASASVLTAACFTGAGDGISMGLSSSESALLDGDICGMVDAKALVPGLGQSQQRPPQITLMDVDLMAMEVKSWSFVLAILWIQSSKHKRKARFQNVHFQLAS
jgi:hypothetical protein